EGIGGKGSAERSLKSVGRGGEVRRGRLPGNVRVARRINGDAQAGVTARAAQVSRVHQGRACGIELGHKGVRGEGAAESGLKRAGRGGEIRRDSVACDVSAARGINGDANALVRVASAQVG